MNVLSINNGMPMVNFKNRISKSNLKANDVKTAIETLISPESIKLLLSKEGQKCLNEILNKDLFERMSTKAMDRRAKAIQNIADIFKNASAGRRTENNCLRLHYEELAKNRINEVIDEGGWNENEIISQ